ncbi:MAG: phosphopantetheine-binding protein, partial [Planctomycetota bacterium]
FLIAFVVEQTGYPEEMVDLNADLEADLGIDSIKIAQMMGETLERFGIQAESLQVRSLEEIRSLSAIVRVLSEQTLTAESNTVTPSPAVTPSAAVTPSTAATPSGAATPSPAVTAATVATTKHDAAAMQAFLVRFVIEQTGYPEEMVELDANLEADLGIDSIKIAQMMGEVVEQFGLDVQSFQGRTMSDFRTLRDVVRVLSQT